MKLIRFVLVGATVFTVLLSFAGCNTVRGVGKDIEKAGEKIQRSTEK